MKQRLRVSACGAAIMARTCPDVSPQSVGTNGYQRQTSSHWKEKVVEVTF